jgi:hypothetical protein
MPAGPTKTASADETLTNLIEHYSQHKLSLSNVADDKLGNAYEYLIKEFADDSGHTAAEFYTNRTVVTLMTKLWTRNRARACTTPPAARRFAAQLRLHLKRRRQRIPHPQTLRTGN